MAPVVLNIVLQVALAVVKVACQDLEYSLAAVKLSSDSRNLCYAQPATFEHGLYWCWPLHGLQ